MDRAAITSRNLVRALAARYRAVRRSLQGRPRRHRAGLQGSRPHRAPKRFASSVGRRRHRRHRLGAAARHRQRHHRQSATLEPRIAFASRDYFPVHRQSPDAGVYLSRPYRSRLRSRDRPIALSRRLKNAGRPVRQVATISLRLAYFHRLFDRFDIGPDGVLMLIRDDGTILVRAPTADDEGDIGALTPRTIPSTCASSRRRRARSSAGHGSTGASGLHLRHVPGTADRHRRAVGGRSDRRLASANAARRWLDGPHLRGRRDVPPPPRDPPPGRDRGASRLSRSPTHSPGSPTAAASTRRSIASGAARSARSRSPC